MAGGRVSPSESSESEGGDARSRLGTVPNLLSGLRLVLAELEEIAITTILPVWRTNVPSILHARRLLREPH